MSLGLSSGSFLGGSGLPSVSPRALKASYTNERAGQKKSDIKNL